MTINVTSLKNNLNTVSESNYEKAATAVAENFSNCEDLLTRAYSVSTTEQKKALAKELGVETTDETALQQVAQAKYEKATRVFSLFSQIMSNTNQILNNIISKIGR